MFKCVYYNEPVSLLNSTVRVVIHVLSTWHLSCQLSGQDQMRCMLLHLTFSLISDRSYDIPVWYYVSALLFLKCSVWNIQLLNTLNSHANMNSQESWTVRHELSDMNYELPNMNRQLWTVRSHERLVKNRQSYMNSQAVIDCVLHSIFTYCIS